MVRAGQGVAEHHSWSVGILHIFAHSDGIADKLKRQLLLLPSELWQRCIVLCTVASSELSSVVFKNVSDWESMPQADRERFASAWELHMQQALGSTAALASVGESWATDEDGGAEREAVPAAPPHDEDGGAECEAVPAAPPDDEDGEEPDAYGQLPAEGGSAGQQDHAEAAAAAAGGTATTSFPLLRESSAYTQVSELSERSLETAEQ